MNRPQQQQGIFDIAGKTEQGRIIKVMSSPRRTGAMAAPRDASPAGDDKGQRSAEVADKQAPFCGQTSATHPAPPAHARDSISPGKTATMIFGFCQTKKSATTGCGFLRHAFSSLSGPNSCDKFFLARGAATLRVLRRNSGLSARTFGALVAHLWRTLREQCARITEALQVVCLQWLNMRMEKGGAQSAHMWRTVSAHVMNIEAPWIYEELRIEN